MPSYDRALWALRTWLDSWSGIGRIAVGMARQGFDLQLTRYDDRGWRATFYTTGKEHSPTSATGTPSERTPWDAVQWPTRETLKRMTDYFAAPPLFGTFRDRCGHCPAHGDEPMGDRLKVEGRLLVPPLPGGLGILKPTRITRLADPGLKHAYSSFEAARARGVPSATCRYR